jgi:hypothetical protein
MPGAGLLDERDPVAQRPLPKNRLGASHFPTEQAGLTCLYLVTRSLDPKGTGQTRWIMR